jgi:hypothetical protein
MKVLPVIRELPVPYLEGIGAVCFEWALLERELALVAYMVLKLGPKQGRLAVRSPRANERLTMIRQLMSLENLEAKGVDLDALGASLTKLQTLRDQMAHGTFLRGRKGEIYLQNLSGHWKPDQKEPKVARRIKPEGVVITADDMKNLGKLIAGCTVAVHQLGLELERARGSSQQRFQQQSEQDHPQDDSNSDTSGPQPQSS